MYNFYFLSFSSFYNQFWLEMNPQWYFLIFKIFLEFSSWRLERNETIIFIFHVFHPFPTYFGLKWTIIIFLLFFEFFIIFMEFSITHRVGTERNGRIIFTFHFLIFFQPIFAWNEAIMVVFNFLNYFAIFLGIFCCLSDRNVSDV